jgi:hypothetical protein
MRRLLSLFQQLAGNGTTLSPSARKRGACHLRVVEGEVRVGSDRQTSTSAASEPRLALTGSSVQQRARVDGMRGIPGILGKLDSVTYRV